MPASPPPPPSPWPATSHSHIPLLYRLIFLWLEPASTLTGAFYAHFRQSYYLALTHSDSAGAGAAPVPIATSIVLTQLANLYALLCINEALVLRATADVHVWKRFMLGLLVADLGHLYSVRLVGSWVYWQVWAWNPIDWGNVGFVYFLALARVCMLLGLGFRSGQHKTSTKRG